MENLTAEKSHAESGDQLETVTLALAEERFESYWKACRAADAKVYGTSFEIVFLTADLRTFSKNFLPYSIKDARLDAHAEMVRLFEQAKSLLVSDTLQIRIRIKDLRALEQRREVASNWRVSGVTNVDHGRAKRTKGMQQRPVRELVEKVLTDRKHREMQDNPGEEVLKPLLLTNLRAGRQTLAEETGGLALRMCQVNALSDLESFLEDPKAGLRGYFVLPTGAGKTVLFGTIIKLLARPAIIYVPNLVLVQQIREELAESLGFHPWEIGLIDHEFKEFGRPITVCTYQSHLRMMENGRADYLAFLRKISVVICDEAHRAMGEKTSSSLDFGDLKEFNQAAMLGFTATPQAVDKHIRRLFHTKISSTPYAELVESGVLVPFRMKMLDGYMLSGREVVNGVIDPSREDEILEREHTLGRLLQELVMLKRTAEGREEKIRAAGFFNRIEQAEAFGKMAEQVGLKPIIVTSRQDEQEGGGSEESYRQLREAEKQIMDGKADILLTVNKLMEGWNFPHLNCVVMGAPSVSPRRIIQSAGRASRKTDDKDWTYLIGIDWKVVKTNHRATAAWFREIDRTGISRDKLLPGMTVLKRYNPMEAFLKNGERTEDIGKICLDLEGRAIDFTPFNPFLVTEPLHSEASLPFPAIAMPTRTLGQPVKSTNHAPPDGQMRETVNLPPSEELFTSPPHLRMALGRIAQERGLASYMFLTHHKFKKAGDDFYSQDKWISTEQFLLLAMEFYQIRDPALVLRHMINMASKA